MRIVGLCTPSHEVLRDRWLLPTLPAGFEPDFTEMAQLCPTGQYASPGFSETMVHKLDVIRRAARDHAGEIIAFQRNSRNGEICTGFLVFRANDEVVKMIDAARALLANWSVHEDQKAVNTALDVSYAKRMHVLPSSRPSLRRVASRAVDEMFKIKRFRSIVSWRYLSQRFWPPGQQTWSVWAPGDPLLVPRNIAVHHANWTFGIDNKLAQLEAVDRVVGHRG